MACCHILQCPLVEAGVGGPANSTWLSLSWKWETERGKNKKKSWQQFPSPCGVVLPQNGWVDTVLCARPWIWKRIASKGWKWFGAKSFCTLLPYFLLSFRICTKFRSVSPVLKIAHCTVPIPNGIWVHLRVKSLTSAWMTILMIMMATTGAMMTMSTNTMTIEDKSSPVPCVSISRAATRAAASDAAKTKIMMRMWMKMRR